MGKIDIKSVICLVLIIAVVLAGEIFIYKGLREINKINKELAKPDNQPVETELSNKLVDLQGTVVSINKENKTLNFYGYPFNYALKDIQIENYKISIDDTTKINFTYMDSKTKASENVTFGDIKPGDQAIINFGYEIKNTAQPYKAAKISVLINKYLKGKVIAKTDTTLTVKEPENTLKIPVRTFKVSYDKNIPIVFLPDKTKKLSIADIKVGSEVIIYGIDFIPRDTNEFAADQIGVTKI